MKHALLVFGCLLIAVIAVASPKPHTFYPPSSVLTTVEIVQGDTSDSEIIPNGGKCFATFLQAGSDTASIYQVPDKETATSGLTAITTFDATTTVPLPLPSGQAGYKVKGVTVSTGGSIVSVRCSNTQLSSSGGAVSVSSWEEIESVMRQADLPAGAQDSHSESATVSIVLADDFVIDTDSTSSFVINLPTGGGDNPFISIDLGGHLIANKAISTLQINAGGASSTCDSSGLNSGYVEFEDGCMGLAHDFNVYVFNGAIANLHDGCDATPTSDCGRLGLEWVDFDLLMRSDGAPYGGRADVNLKIGVDTQWSGVTSYPQLQLPTDACMNVPPTITKMAVSGGQFDCRTGVRIDDWDPALSTVLQYAGAITFDHSFRYTQVTSDETDEIQGLVRALIDMDGSFSGVGESGVISGHGFRLGGQLGNLRGGTLDISAFVQENTAADCGAVARGSTDYFINGGGGIADFLSGHVVLVGEICSRGLIRSNAIEQLKIELYLNESNGGLPGFLQADSDLSSGRFSIPASGASAEIDVLDVEIHVSPRVDSSDIVYSDFLSASIISGAALTNANSYVRVDLGKDGFAQCVGSTPVCLYSKSDTKTYTSAFEIVDSRTGSATETVAAEQMDGRTIIATHTTGPTDFTLPTAVKGMSARFVDTEGDGIVIDTADANDTIELYGTALTAGNAIDSPLNIGDCIDMVATAANTWLALLCSGTFTDGGAD